jgi:hypothetical protein
MIIFSSATVFSGEGWSHQGWSGEVLFVSVSLLSFAVAVAQVSLETFSLSEGTGQENWHVLAPIAEKVSDRTA